jgi:putative transcriptional regulator
VNEKHMIRARVFPDGRVVQIHPNGSTEPLLDRTDHGAFETLTEAEIQAAANSDPDNPPLSAEELRSMRPVPNPKTIRKRLRLTQEQFALQFQVPLGTLRDWEQGAKQPEAAARTLLRVIEKNPAAVLEALKGQ